MFEDFREKVGRLQNKDDSKIPLTSTELAPVINEKLRKAGIDPITLPFNNFFPRFTQTEK